MYYYNWAKESLECLSIEKLCNEAIPGDANSAKVGLIRQATMYGKEF
jgi:hypothetical protein